jgi:FixJ family two-component response regulator
MDNIQPGDAAEKIRKVALISVVDDDDLMRSSTQRLLGITGYTCEIFSSAEEFLQSGRVEDTSCLLVDVRMPGMGGLELQRHLAEVGLRVPIIFVSARASEEEERRAMDAGASDFLRKPVSPEVLLQAIRIALKDRPSRRENGHEKSH